MKPLKAPNSQSNPERKKKLKASHSVHFVRSLSCVRLSTTPCTCSMPGFPVHHQLPEPAQTHVH